MSIEGNLLAFSESAPLYASLLKYDWDLLESESEQDKCSWDLRGM